MFSHDQSYPILATIVIPTLNEVKNIQKTLESIVKNQITKSELEVLVVDGGSQDETLNIVRGFANFLQLHIIEAPGSTVYRALNIGLKSARGKYFIRVDARSQIPPIYIQTCLDHFTRDPEVECVGGIQLQFGGGTLIADSIATVTASKLGTGGAKFRTATSSGYVDSVYLGVYRTQLLRELGGFEDGSDFVSEDAFINKRIRNLGKKIFLDTNLKIKYPAKTTFRSLIKQYVIYGAAKAFILRKHGQLTSVRQTIPLLFFIGWVVLFLAIFLNWTDWTALVVAFLSYVLLLILSDTIDYFNKKHHEGFLWARIIATMSIHFAWPIGFLLSLLSKNLHRKLVNYL